mgnify:CR=1 FL=1
MEKIIVKFLRSFQINKKQQKDSLINYQVYQQIVVHFFLLIYQKPKKKLKKNFMYDEKFF